MQRNNFLHIYCLVRLWSSLVLLMDEFYYILQSVFPKSSHNELITFTILKVIQKSSEGSIHSFILLHLKKLLRFLVMKCLYFSDKTMRLILVGLTLGLSALLTSAQQPARIGPDGKPLLNRPILEECKKSKNIVK